MLKSELKRPSYALKKVQGLICKGLKKNRAKIIEKGLNCKESPKVEGYLCEYRKTQGAFLQKCQNRLCLTGLTWLTRSRSIPTAPEACG
jgi:hypothetical protein